MPLTQPSGVLAKALFDGLLEGEARISVPAVDLTTAEYAHPNGLSDIHTAIVRLDESALTSREMNGTGMFDGIMAAISSHLKNEFRENRITGKEYSTAYVALVQSALASATQYLVSAEQTFWQSRLVQEQAKLAEIQKVQGLVELELAKNKLAAARMEVLNLEAALALTKMKLSTEDASFRSIEAQVVQTTYQTSTLLPSQNSQILAQTALATKEGVQKDYETSQVLPAQVQLLVEQREAARAQTADNRFDGAVVAGSIGKQKALYDQQITSYQRDAEYKLGKLFHDTWVISKTVDEGWPTPATLNDASINAVITNLRTRLSI